MMPRAWGIGYKVRRETSDRHGEGAVQREGNDLMRKRQKGNVRVMAELKCILMVVVDMSCYIHLSNPRELSSTKSECC